MTIYRSDLEKSCYFLKKLQETKERLENLTHLTAIRTDSVKVQTSGGTGGEVDKYENRKENLQGKYNRYANLYLQATEMQKKALDNIKDATLKTIIQFRFQLNANWSDIRLVTGMKKTQDVREYYYRAFTSDGRLKDEYLIDGQNK